MDKTAVQLIIEELTGLKNEALASATQDRENNQDSSVNDSNYVAYLIAINVCKKQIETEIKQIKDAYDCAAISWSDMVIEINDTKEYSERYFNDKFK